MIKLRTIDDLGDVSGKRVLLRADLNVAISGGKVAEPFRVDSVLPTIQLLIDKGAKIGLISHIENEEGATLFPVWQYMSKKIDVSFVKTLPELTAELLTAKTGEVFLMENLRQYEGEKGNDLAFGRELSAAADFYVNDAFSVSHREHASVVGVSKFLPAAAGPLLIREIEELSKTFSAPHPLAMILSGAKLETKLPLIEKFVGKADAIFVAGALGNDLLKARGFPVGKSKVSQNAQDLSNIVKAKNVIAPVDVFTESAGEKDMKMVEAVLPGDVIVDIGPQSIRMLEVILEKSAFVVWNGPLGIFEKGYVESSKRVAEAIVKSKAYSVVGGGDTISALEPYDVLSKFSFVSTGGGAMIDFLAEGTLPGIEILKK